MSDLFVTETKIKAREIAYSAVAKLRPESTSLIEYQSRGHVIIIANTEAILSNDELERFGDSSRSLSSEIIHIKGKSPSSSEEDEVTIEGALGQFVVHAAGKEYKSDLILDLSPNPILSMSYKPPGYLSTGTEPLNIYKIRTELEDLVGTFEKPKYIDYNESVCAHGRSGKSGCTRCIDACPAEAIISLVNKVEVDTNRCHGGGICATVCPSSALTYTYPKPKDLLTHVRTLILTYTKELSEEGEVATPDLVFATEEEQARVEQILPAALVITVEEVASVGPEVWLSALVWGARSVRLFALDGMPESAQQALDLHVSMVQKTLAAMNYPANVVSVIIEESELITSSYLSDVKAATHAALDGKRQAFYMALDHLVEQAKDAQMMTLLPSGSSFGDVSIDKSSCTLCMSCVSACPGNALQDGHEKPMVSLVEGNCLQCGICVNTCPENAMSISPRLILNRKLRLKPRVLHEDEPFCCTSCGKPFATKSGITTILTKLAGHSMFADQRARDRLKMCDDCRVVDMMEDPATDF